jgi:pyruvate kinase
MKTRRSDGIQQKIPTTGVEQTKQTGEVQEAQKTQDASATFERSGLQAAPGVDFDALWNAGRYAECVKQVHAEYDGLKGTKVEQLDPTALGELIHELHLTQHRLIGLSNKLSMVDEGGAKREALALLQGVGEIQTRAAEMAFAIADGNEPDRAVSPWIVHKNTRKQQGPSTRDERLAYFASKAKKFITKGGSMGQIRPVELEELKKFPSGRLVEWAVDEFDVARIADADKEPAPGHTLLAMGNDALSAGSMRLYKGDDGEIEQVVLGTFSGHFRADATTLGHMARHLVAAGLPPEKIVIQGGEAGTARALEVLHRSIGMGGDEAQREQAQLNAEAARYNPYALQVADEEPKGPEVEAKGERPAADAHEVMGALETMRQASASALADGVVLESLGEGTGLAGAIDKVLTLAEQAGNPVAYEQARALLNFFTSDGGPITDAAAKKALVDLGQRWDKHVFGQGAMDPADVFSARPADGRRTRIVATLNPKASEAQIREMLTAGLDVARFNPAHSSIPELKAAIALVRTTAAKLDKQVSIQIDLPGPKIRLGKFENPNNAEFNDIFLNEGETVSLSNKPGLGTAKVLPIDLESLGADVKVGDRFFMNDGLVELQAKEVKKDAKGNDVVVAEVVRGGKVWDKKGVNMPDSKLSLPTITDSDKEILDAIAKDIDVLALSFVRDPQDLLQGREELRNRGVDIPIIAKIERPEAVQNLEAIAHLSDGLMVARGDLGVEIGRENVPFVERQIHSLGNRLGKPTMTATEVLMSMAKGAGRATRGDIEGLYAAVHDHGADAVMLGKETSYPEHPGRVVGEAALAIGRAEEDLREKPYRNIADGSAPITSPMGTRFS